MHKIEIAQQAIDISMRRRGRVQPFVVIKPRKTALLVVDMQTGFLEPAAVAEIPAAREIVPNINRLAGALRRAGGTVVWIVSTYGPGAEQDWTTFFNFIMTGESTDRFCLAFQEGRPEHTLWRELDRHAEDPVVSKNRLTPFVDPSRKLETMLRSRGIDMPIEEVLAPAIGYAEDGFPVLPRLTMALLPLVEFFKAEWPSSTEVWLPHGRPPEPWTLYRTPAVGAAYRRILAEAKAAGSARERQIEAARDAFLSWFRGRGHRPICNPQTQYGWERTAPRQPVDGRGHDGLARHLGGKRGLRLRPLSRPQDRSVGPRACAVATIGVAERFRFRCV
jgi:hypothetical protein